MRSTMTSIDSAKRIESGQPGSFEIADKRPPITTLSRLACHKVADERPRAIAFIYRCKVWVGDWVEVLLKNRHYY